VLSLIPGDAPERLSRATILLPTRRSARALRTAFLRAAAGRALLLPRMRALAGLSTEDADELALPTLLDLPPAVDAMTRLAVLTRMIATLPARHGGPRTVEQAWALAGALATLLDEMALEERDLALFDAPESLAEGWLERLAALVPESQAAHWQITLIFLRAVVRQWQGWLAEKDLLDIGIRRVLALRAQAAAWASDPPPYPVIAAGIGIGGTIPAATALLRAIARDLPQGAVVLHGLDRLSAEQVWDVLPQSPTHPFCGQQRLLAELGAAREDVRPWPGAARHAVPEGRPALLGMALRPAAGIPAWQARRPHVWEPALAGLSRLEAPDAQVEATAIALLLREALEDPKARAALVTPDRDLARRVSAELARHGVACDDSAGEPLGETAAGAFLRLIARMVAEDFAPVPLLSVLKHPLCAGGMDRVDWVRLVRRLEQAALRGPRPAAGLAGLRAAVAAAFAGRRQDPAAQAELAALLDRLEACMGSFVALPPSPAQPPEALLAAHLAAAEVLAATADQPGPLRLYAGDEGEVLASHLARLPPALAELGPIAPESWPALLDATLDGAAAPSFRGSRGRESGPHPRVEILGLLEARLLTFDRIVLGALDESIWPLGTDPGPWMSRPMRRDFGLPEPEARIGRVCADFVLTACAAPVAVLSRAARRAGQPTVPARWLTRIETFLKGQTGAEHPDGLRLASSPAASWAALLDQPKGDPAPCARPAPSPPRAARPRRLSVTSVALLLADPYAFYARHVLRLTPLEPLDAEPDAADYGILVHAVLAGFLRRLPDGRWPGHDAAQALYAAAAEAALAEAGSRPGLVAFWRPRLARIGGFVLEQEAALRARGRIRRSLPEAAGKAVLHAEGRDEVTLEARADRIDILADGTLAILDYKTGGTPTGRQIGGGDAAQLPLEAAIARRGGFADVAEAMTSSALYWQLTGGFVPGMVTDAGDKLRRHRKAPSAVQALQEEAENAWDSARRLAADYLLGTRRFIARPHPGRRPRGTEYDHLTRLGEWAGAQEAAEDGA
jgi:ATP-dependent helicase/nuclease subunit B